MSTHDHKVDPSEGSEVYEKMMQLEELESLLEELDEGVDDNLSERLAGLLEQGINTREDLAQRIAALHAELDKAET